MLNSLQPTADVNDFAGLLTPAEKESLESRCRELRARTGAQLAVVTLQSLRGGEIEDFTNKLFARWHVGQKGKDNGLMLLVAMDDRKSRLEVGYGLEPIIPDVLAAGLWTISCGRRFGRGSTPTVFPPRSIEICELVEKGAPADRQALEAEPDLSVGEMLVFMVVLTLFVAVGSFMCGMGCGRRQIAGLWFGLVFAAIPMIVGLTAIGPLSLAIHLPVAVVLTALGWNAAKKSNQSGTRPMRRSSYEPSVWTWGDSSGSSGGWNTGGGGFSQGWGGFGGGTSGRWRCERQLVDW